MKGNGALHVIFHLGPAEYALPADVVLHMESYTGVTPVPGTASYVAGLVQIRGRVVPVVDLRARFGLPPAPIGLDSRVIVIRAHERSVGLLVDSAREVLPIPAEQFKPPPEVVAEQAQGFIEAVAQLGTRLLMRIDCRKVIGEEQDHGGTERSTGS